MTPQAAALDLAIHAVDQALSEPDKKIGPAGVPQLIKFRVNLESMRNALSSGRLPPKGERSLGMSKVIADSWPFDSSVGRLIIRAERLYCDA